MAHATLADHQREISISASLITSSNPSGPDSATISLATFSDDAVIPCFNRLVGFENRDAHVRIHEEWTVSGPQTNPSPPSALGLDPSIGYVAFAFRSRHTARKFGKYLKSHSGRAFAANHF